MPALRRARGPTDCAAHHGMYVERRWRSAPGPCSPPILHAVFKTAGAAGPHDGRMDTIDIDDTKTAMGVWAHPDDESYLSAGLMLRVAGRGGRVVCVTMTRGEQGTDDPERWPPHRLGE